MSAPARGLCAVIALYQRAFAWRPSPCRYEPSCSAYARGAIEQHGAVRGTGLAVRRLLRCQPWGGFGFDPVPDRAPRRADAETGMRTTNV